MTVLHIDFETRSTLDLRKVGVYVYANHPTTDLWCACYAFDDKPVQVSRSTGPFYDNDPRLNPKIRGHLHPGFMAYSERVAKHVRSGGLIVAHNAAFERVIWENLLGPRYGWPIPKIEQWRCTMVQAYAMALPGALEDAALAVGLGNKKDAAGRRLMLQMCRPRSVVGDKISWWDEPEKKERLIAYCKQDVETERELYERLRPLKESELALWHLDQRINDRGVCVDTELCDAAKKIVAATTEKLDEEMRHITDGIVSRCSNRNQLVGWLKAQGVEAESIAKNQIEELLSQDLPAPVRAALTIRRESAKASVAKIDALLRGMDLDRRTRGLCQFHAASTGRWAGRRFQPQNLKRPDLETAEEVDVAIDFILHESVEFIEAVYGPPLSVVGDTIRGMIVAPFGKKIVSVDYSGIEARVLPWLADEHWKLDAFRAFDAGEGEDIYKLTAGGILGKPPASVSKKERLAYGKVPELALGYQGGVGAFTKMAANYGVQLSVPEIEAIRDGFRANNPKIRNLWTDLEYAAIQAVYRPGTTWWVGDKIVFRMAGSFLFMRLPSKRFLIYPYPAIREKMMPWKDDNGADVYKDSLTYFSTIDVSKQSKIVPDKHNGSKWARIASYGGMLAENATQAVARDYLADAMPRVDAAGYEIILTVHDEIVAEVAQDFGSWQEMAAIMTTLPEWGATCPIAAEGWEGMRYRK